MTTWLENMRLITLGKLSLFVFFHFSAFIEVFVLAVQKMHRKENTDYKEKVKTVRSPSILSCETGNRAIKRGCNLDTESCMVNVLNSDFQSLLRSLLL